MRRRALHDVEERAELAQLSTNEPGILRSRSFATRSPSSSSRSTPSAAAMRSGEPKALMSTGVVKPSTFSKSSARFVVGGPLRHAVGDLGDLEVARDGRGHAAELAALLEVRDELAEIGEGHACGRSLVGESFTSQPGEREGAARDARRE